ncbi:aminoacetone oxidase family FAD-binding enzyme [Candidatus Peregrinibacteria bacterium]|nr:aminoacetone oxidase family FAD-binding enzyme [Candidatus Peregrinibacteria bacterium]
MVQIAIIGGGAAGMMAAATVAEQSPEAKVVLIERNKILGQKVRLSGGGRCNVTTGFSDMDEILRRYPRGRNFVKHAFYSFPPEKVMEWFEAHGVPLKTEEDRRVFPQSDKGDDVVGAFENLYQKLNVQVILGNGVQSISKVEGKFVIALSSGDPITADRVLIASGGEARATGGGYALASSLGHTITPLAPSLNAFVVQESWVKELAGVSFLSARFKLKGAHDFEFTGPFVFSHRGVTGPAVFSVSSLGAYELLKPEVPTRLLVDLLPTLGEPELLQKLQGEMAAHPKKTFENVMAHLVFKSVAEVACKELGIPAEKICAEMPRKDVNRSVAWLKGVPLTVIGRAAGDEFVTAGGVSLKEVDSKTMESKICPGLFLAGEVLDVDAFTGGFNLQSAWATGRLAGKFMAISK